MISSPRLQLDITTDWKTCHRDCDRRLPERRRRGDADRDRDRRLAISSFIFFAFCFALKNSNKPSFSHPSLQLYTHCTTITRHCTYRPVPFINSIIWSVSKHSFKLGAIMLWVTSASISNECHLKHLQVDVKLWMLHLLTNVWFHQWRVTLCCVTFNSQLASATYMTTTQYFHYWTMLSE